MNMSYSLVLLVTVAIGAISCSVVMPTQDMEGNNDSSTAVQIFTDVVEKSESSPDGLLVTPFDFITVFSEIAGKMMRCWRCSSPCSGTTCCDNGYPQCCRVNGICGCCRIRA